MSCSRGRGSEAHALSMSSPGVLGGLLGWVPRWRGGSRSWVLVHSWCEDIGCPGASFPLLLFQLHDLFPIAVGPLVAVQRDSEGGLLVYCSRQRLRGAVQKIFRANLGFCPNRLDPPPSPNVGTKKTKKKIWCLFFILGYSKHIIFSWKISFFGLVWRLGGSNTLMNW